MSDRPIIWDYRIMRHRERLAANDETHYAIHEVHYLPCGGIKNWTAEPCGSPCGETREEMVRDLAWILAGLTKPVLDAETGQVVDDAVLMADDLADILRDKIRPDSEPAPAEARAEIVRWQRVVNRAAAMLGALVEDRSAFAGTGTIEAVGDQVREIERQMIAALESTPAQEAELGSLAEHLADRHKRKMLETEREAAQAAQSDDKVRQSLASTESERHRAVYHAMSLIIADENTKRAAYYSSNDADFLDDLAKYFDDRPTGGEDRAHWANISNADNCRRIAALLRSANRGDNK